MASIIEVRTALADLLKTSLEMQYALGYWPGKVQPLGVYVVPQAGGDYVSFENGTFCRATLSLSAIIVGPTTNQANAAKWLDAAIALAPDAMNTDPTLGGLASNVVLDAVTEPGLINIEGSGAYLSAELRFRPFYIT